MNPFIIPIFLPQMGCPYHCLYCNQKTITQRQPNALTWETFSAVVEAGLSSKKKKIGQEVEIAFFGGTFTNLPSAFQNQLLHWAGSYMAQKRVQTVRLSTRPDALSNQKITYLFNNGVRTIELGIQSLDDKVLALANRGHTRQEAIQTMALIKKYSIRLGVQLMVGLPGDSEQGFLQTVKQIIALKPDLVRIYPTLVFQETPLAQWFKEGRYKPLSLDEAVSLCSRALEFFEAAGIRVIRLGLQDHAGMRSDQGLMAGPFHPAFGSLVRGELYVRRIVRDLKTRRTLPASLVLHIASQDMAYLLGQKKKNLRSLTQRLGVSTIDLEADPGLPPGNWRFGQHHNPSPELNLGIN